MPKGEGARKSSMLGKAVETDVDSLKQEKDRDAESGNAVNPENSNAVNTAPESDDPSVSLTIKVPLSYRQHWQIEAKKRSTSVTKLIVEALGEKLGLPE